MSTDPGSTASGKGRSAPWIQGTPPRVTICVLCYGNHPELADRFLQSLYRFTDPQAFTLRAGLNEVCAETGELFARFSDRFGNIETFIEVRNVFKSPMMRRLFHEKPLSTGWVIWFDDDSYLTRADWLPRLFLQIAREPDVAQWGKQFLLWRRDEEIERFIVSAPWYRGLPLREGEGPEGTRSAEFRFATGGFWAMRRDVIDALDWPDPRLVHSAEDFLLGEALRQNGFRTESFEHGVRVNEAERRNRGATEAQALPPT